MLPIVRPDTIPARRPQCEEEGGVFEKGLLAGKRVLITGGGTGLGRSMGRRFVELGDAEWAAIREKTRGDKA
jgi:FlaA1/EpsC-like NDP-sugar epimerase